MKRSQGFKLLRFHARRARHARADDGVVELLDQLFTDARKFPAALLTKLGKALKAERERIASLEAMLDEVASEVSFSVFASPTQTSHELRSIRSSLSCVLTSKTSTAKSMTGRHSRAGLWMRWTLR
jgi:hypothetical protein